MKRGYLFLSRGIGFTVAPASEPIFFIKTDQNCLIGIRESEPRFLKKGVSYERAGSVC